MKGLKMLSVEMKKRLLKMVEKQNIDIDDLDSAQWIPNIYGVEPHLAVGGWDYDENEYFSKQAQQLADGIDEYGLGGYFGDLPEELYDDEQYHEEVVNFLRGL